MFALLSTLTLAQTTVKTWHKQNWLYGLVIQRIALDMKHAIKKDEVSLDTIKRALDNHFPHCICTDILATYNEL